MSKGGATAIVLLTGLALVVFALLGEKDSGSRFKKIWAAGLLTTGLSVTADFVPELTGPFALLVLIAAAVNNKGAVGNLINGGGKAAPASKVQGG